MRPLRAARGIAHAVACGAGLLLAAAAAAEPGPRALRLPAGERIAVDGRLDDAAWRAAPEHDRFHQYHPQDRVPPPADYRTTVQVVAEAEALVIGVRAFDPRPDEIRAPLVRRDQVKREQDFVAVFVDPVGDRRAAQFVRVNAAGAIGDGLYLTEADGESEDYAPDFDVEAAVQRLPDGWSVELRLPLLVLRYPAAGAAPWRLMVARSIPRDAATLVVSAPLGKDALHFIAELQPIDDLAPFVAAARSHAIVAVRPELTLRSTRRRSADGRTSSDREAALGVDLKWRPRADWVFDATLNPDFSQVELDTPQLTGNTRFALSVPEKRPFFLESADVLDLPIGTFYSRSVTDPGYGLRATWRGESADAVALTLRDDGGGIVLLPRAYGTDAAPADLRSQASLARARVHLGAVSVGAVLTERRRDDGGANRVAGADIGWRSADGNQLVQARALRSATTALYAPDGTPVVGDEQSAGALEARWRGLWTGWSIDAKASRVEAGFRNDNGFVSQSGVRRVEAELIRRWGEQPIGFAGGGGFTADEFETYAWVQRQTTLADAGSGVAGGERITERFHPGLWFSAARNTESWIQLELDRERVRPDGTLHATRAAAAFWQSNPAPWWPLVRLEGKFGRLLDVDADRTARGLAWEAEATLRASLANGWGVESNLLLARTRLAAPEAGTALDDSAAQWIGVLHVSAAQSLRLVAQNARTRRRADAAAGLAAGDDAVRTRSVVWQHRRGLARAFSVGATHEQVSPGRARQTEVFAKAAVAW